MIAKTLQRSEDCFIQFTEEELEQLNIKPGDKFTCEIKNGSLLLKKFETLEIDISEYSREALEMLIKESVEKDISVNEVITNILSEQIDRAHCDGILC